MQKYLLTFIIGFLIFINGWGQSVNPQLLWSTYFGSPGDDFIGFVITDEDNNIYLSSTFRNGAITTEGVHQTTYGGGISDAMLSKFDKNGNLIWSTYFGGEGEDGSYYKLALTSDNGIVMTGYTDSQTGIASPGAYHDQNSGDYDVFLAVFETTGKLRWATYFGGEKGEFDPDICVDSNDNIYLVGYTESVSGISTENAFQSTRNGSNDAFMAKFDKSGLLKYATYYGGSGTDYFNRITTDSSGNVYAVGYTTSSQVATTSSFKNTYSGSGDGLFVKFDQNGDRVWASYFGSIGKDEILNVGVDNKQNVYIIGQTTSMNNIATSGSYAQLNSGKEDLFIAKFNTNGERDWSTFFGGEEFDVSVDFNFDKSNNIYVGLVTSSYGLPISEEVHGPYYNGGTEDAGFAKFSPEGDLIWCTYFGGVNSDRGTHIYIDGEQNMVCSISSDSKDLATFGNNSNLPRGRDALLFKMKDATTVNVDEIQTLSKIQCFPNPTSDKIEIPNPLAINRNITIFGANGAMVLRHINTYQSQFNVRNLPPGIYYILLDENLLISSGKFLKVE